MQFSTICFFPFRVFKNKLVCGFSKHYNKCCFLFEFKLNVGKLE